MNLLKPLAAALIAAALFCAPARAQDATSSLLQLLMMGQGLHNNDWGTQTNANLTKVENAIAGISSFTVSGGTITLTSDQSRSVALSFTGTLGGNQTVTVPSLSKFWIVRNNTSGAYTLSLKTAAGSPIVVPQSSSLVHIFWCDGTNVIDVSADGIATLTNGTALANIGAGPTAVPFASLATAMTLGTTSVPTFLGLDLSGAVGTLRALYWQTSGSNRWYAGANTAAESGSNFGSDFLIGAYADDGTTLLGPWMSIIRKTGNVNFPQNVAIGGTLTVAGALVSAATPDSIFRDLVAISTSATAVTVTATSFTATDGSSVKLFGNLNATLSVSCANAINCMDTGGPGTSRWLQLWAIGKPDGTSAAILTQAAHPTPPALPTGYTFYARVGAVRMDAGGNLYRSIQRGNVFRWIVGVNPVTTPMILNATVGSVTVPTYVAQTNVLATSGAWPAAAAPPTAKAVNIVLGTAGAGGTYVLAAPNGSFGAYNAALNPPPLMASGGGIVSADIGVELSTSLYFASNAGASTTIATLGFTDTVNAN